MNGQPDVREIPFNEVVILLQDSIPFGSEKEWGPSRSIDQCPLCHNLFPKDVETIVRSLDENGIDSATFASRLNALYIKAGKPVVEGDLSDETVPWRSLLGAGLDFVSTALHLQEVQQGSLLEDCLMSRLALPKITVDAKRKLPFYQRQGLQNNVAVKVGYYSQDPLFEPLKDQARRVVFLSKQRSGSKLEENKLYLQEKLALEKDYLRILLEV